VDTGLVAKNVFRAVMGTGLVTKCAQSSVGHRFGNQMCFEQWWGTGSVTKCAQGSGGHRLGNQICSEQRWAQILSPLSMRI
jgi:hypothetical protein